ncbi:MULTISPECIES: LysR substrate-binding domain-containing protein [Halomonadaceae]|uniref:LysR substrate-binding domain-containing protein n=1 Tax=Halomonadaceae TaxID=28256 RepID=UPI00159B7289|nr:MULTISPECIES: LysR substrate-binding domain-containing protein [Halomonas]QJQ96059.1 LysR family transcriptional regulator [Halomonas sp. PA5]
MRRPLPPLNALRAFEAVARLHSVTLAADELHVTHGAVSHQIKTLEAALGISLFHRDRRQLRLNQTGLVYSRQVREALRLLSESTLKLGLPSVEGRLHVSCPPTLATKWLAYQLRTFRAAFPDIDLTVVPRNLDDEEVATGDYDVAVVYGNGEWERRQVQLLANFDMTPVCHPRFFEASDQPHQVNELRGGWLLHEDAGGNWKRWLATVGASVNNLGRGTHLLGAHLTLESAAAGFGVALGDRIVCAQDFARGNLVRLFEAEVPAPQAYYLVCAPHRVDEPRILLFCDWIQARIEHTLGRNGNAPVRRTDLQ